MCCVLSDKETDVILQSKPDDSIPNSVNQRLENFTEV